MKKIYIIGLGVLAAVSAGAAFSAPQRGISMRPAGAQEMMVPMCIYSAPIGSLYSYGAPEELPVMQLQPCGVRLDWWNMSLETGESNYNWQYDTTLPVVGEDAESLTLCFPWPKTSAFDAYPSPGLEAEWEDGVKENYNENVQICAGGDLEVNGDKYAVLPFNERADGIYVHTETDAADPDAPGIPIFGYDNRCDHWWRVYTANGEEDSPNVHYAYVTGILNVMLPPETPLVINGAFLTADAKFSNEAEFTMAIYATDEDGQMKPTPLASKSIKGSETILMGKNGEYDYVALPFQFDEPAVLTEDGTEGFYGIMLTGFHDPEHVEYFGPDMQERPNQFEIAMGMYQIEINYKDEGHFVGYSHVANHENEWGEMYCTFAIAFNAEYPWLSSDTEALTLEPAETVAEGTLALSSFYEASALSVTMADGSALPEWLDATSTGRFDDSRITFHCDRGAEPFDADVLISAPGVSTTVRLSKTSGIDDLISDLTEPARIYNLLGQPVTNEYKGLVLTPEGKFLRK